MISKTWQKSWTRKKKGLMLSTYQKKNSTFINKVLQKIKSQKLCMNDFISSRIIWRSKFWNRLWRLLFGDFNAQWIIWVHMWGKYFLELEGWSNFEGLRFMLLLRRGRVLTFSSICLHTQIKSCEKLNPASYTYLKAIFKAWRRSREKFTPMQYVPSWTSKYNWIYWRGVVK